MSARLSPPSSPASTHILSRYSLLSMLGLAIHGFWEALCISSYVAIDFTGTEPAIPLSPLLMLALVIGIIPSTLFSTAYANLARRHLVWFALCAGIAALFLALALPLPAWEIVFLLGGSLFAGTLLPPLLTLFFSQVAMQAQAILLGLAHAVGEMAALCALYTIQNATVDVRNTTLLVMVGSLLCLGGLFLYILNTTQVAELPQFDDRKPATQASGSRAYVTSLVVVAVLFFLLHSFHDTNYRSFAPTATGLPFEWRALSLLSLPMLGFVALRWGLFPLAAFSLALSVFSPALHVYPVGQWAYSLVSVIDSVGYHGGFFFLLLALARLAHTGTAPALVRALPYMCMYGAFALTWCLSELYPLPEGSTMLISMFALGGSIAGVGWWRQLEDHTCHTPHAGNQTARTHPARPVADGAGTDRSSAQRDAFTVLYGISVREAEVLKLLCEGLSYSQIAHRLRIAETTIKVHISRMLKKVGVKTRHELLNQALETSSSRND